MPYGLKLYLWGVATIGLVAVALTVVVGGIVLLGTFVPQWWGGLIAIAWFVLCMPAFVLFFVRYADWLYDHIKKARSAYKA